MPRLKKNSLLALAIVCISAGLLRYALVGTESGDKGYLFIAQYGAFLQERMRNLPVPDPSKVAFPDSPQMSDLAKNFNNFSYFYHLSQSHMDSAMHWIDVNSNLPVMRLSAQEEKLDFRVEKAANWVSSQSLAVVATARNAMPGIKSTVRNLRSLCSLFAHCSIVFLENDSHDETREFLYQQTKSNPSITLIGCGKINSPHPCLTSTFYSSGKAHQPGSKMKRSFQDEVERGMVMSALRNQLLAYVYSHLATNHSLLLSIDPDLYWTTWEDKTMLQGLYYFASRPQLDSLCASSFYYLVRTPTIYDPCTLTFFGKDAFGAGDPGEIDEADARRSSATLSSRWPVKVKSCFQALTFYRMSSLYDRRLLYRKGHGEWICEHNTISRQLSENYIDPNMLLRVRTGNFLKIFGPF